MAWLRGVKFENDDLTFVLQVLVDDLENLVSQITRLDKRINLLLKNVDVMILHAEANSTVAQPVVYPGDVTDHARRNDDKEEQPAYGEQAGRDARDGRD